MDDHLFRNPYFEKFSQFRKSESKAFLLKGLLQLPMLPWQTISFQIIQQIRLDQFLNVLEASSSTDSISDIDEYSDEFELVFDQFGKNILDLLVEFWDSDWVCALLFILTDDIAIVRYDWLQKSKIESKCTRWGWLMICMNCVSWNIWTLVRWNSSWCLQDSRASFLLLFVACLLIV